MLSSFSLMMTSLLPWSPFFLLLWPLYPLGCPTEEDPGCAYAGSLSLSAHLAYRKHSLTNSGRAGQPQHSSNLLGSAIKAIGMFVSCCSISRTGGRSSHCAPRLPWGPIWHLSQSSGSFPQSLRLPQEGWGLTARNIST